MSWSNMASSNENESMMEVDDSSKVVSFLTAAMPPEILSKILHHLDRNSRVTLRLTSHFLKKFVDEYLGVYVVINDQTQSQDTLSFFSRVAIRKAVVERASVVPFSSLFKYPQYLDSIFIDGEVHTNFLEGLLTSCPQLRILILLGEIRGVLPQRITDNSQSFRQTLMYLKSIDIRISFSTFASNVPYEDEQQSCFNMMNFLSTFHAPLLETCCLDSWITKPYDRYKVTGVLLSFLEIHTKLKGVLVYFRMATKDFSDNVNVISYPLSDYEKQLCSRLKNLSKQLQLSTCILSSVPFSNLWEFFLKDQTRLHTLSFCDKSCSWGPCEVPLRNNWESMKVVYILLEFRFPVDFAVFSECRSLRDLILINTASREILPGIPIDLLSFDKVLSCQKLQFCAMSNIILERRDLWKLIKLADLKYLALLSSGYGFETGVNIDLLKALLGSRQLEALLIDGTVAADEAEAEKIYEMMQLTRHVDVDGTNPTETDIRAGLVVNIRPSYTSFHQWTPNPQGDGFLFNMEFDHNNP
ncbi:unnamed protein product [Orchesella dallaii]|uniref:F-box domain-containing protein n=1 Tax=Orchesella dallaii TaxID=48710 RepID=A0ABP1Q829_9HEXA